MKYIKMFDSFENDLTEEQSDDLAEIFFDFIKRNKMGYKDAEDYFKPGTQEFADFLVYLEDETTWFDYRQIDDVMIEISNLILELSYQEDEDIEIDDEEGDPDLDIIGDIEAGDYVDFGKYGKLYVVTILGDGYLVSENETQRYLGDNGDGFIIPLSAGDKATIIEKGDEEDYDDDDDDDGDIFY